MPISFVSASLDRRIDHATATAEQARASGIAFLAAGLAFSAAALVGRQFAFAGVAVAFIALGFAFPGQVAQAGLNRAQDRAQLLIAAIALFACAAGLPRVLPVPDVLVGMLYGMGAGCLFGVVFAWLTPAACDSATPSLRRRYRANSCRRWPPTCCWCCCRCGCSSASTRHGCALVALLPLPPIAFAAARDRAPTSAMRTNCSGGSNWRRSRSPAPFVSFAYLTGGFLQAAGVIEVGAANAMLWVFPLTCLAYGVVRSWFRAVSADAEPGARIAGTPRLVAGLAGRAGSRSRARP